MDFRLACDGQIKLHWGNSEPSDVSAIRLLTSFSKFLHLTSRGSTRAKLRDVPIYLVSMVFQLMMERSMELRQT